MVQLETPNGFCLYILILLLILLPSFKLSFKLNVCLEKTSRKSIFLFVSGHFGWVYVWVTLQLPMTSFNRASYFKSSTSSSLQQWLPSKSEALRKWNVGNGEKFLNSILPAAASLPCLLGKMRCIIRNWEKLPSWMLLWAQWNHSRTSWISLRFKLWGWKFSKSIIAMENLAVLLAEQQTMERLIIKMTKRERCNWKFVHQWAWTAHFKLGLIFNKFQLIYDTFWQWRISKFATFPLEGFWSPFHCSLWVSMRKHLLFLFLSSLSNRERVRLSLRKSKME